MKKSSRRGILLIVGLFVLVGLLAIVAVASVFAYRQFVEEDKTDLTFSITGERQISDRLTTDEGVVVYYVNLLFERYILL